MVIFIDENESRWEQHADRRSVDLIVPGVTPARAGLSLGVAVWTEPEFGPLQSHDDQEAVYCVSGKGVIRIGEEEYDIYPGLAFYIGKGVPHSTRRTGPEGVKIVYVHAPA